MSSPIVIRAENVSKKYVISHLAKQQTIRDAMHHGLRLLWRRLRWQAKLNREEFWALKDVSFEVKQGEVLGIIGSNGAGKSTVLKVLSRITEPTNGRIYINGRVSSLLEVGTGFHPELTGRENIFLNGAILGMSRTEVRAKFDEIVDFAEIDQFIDTPVKRYSSGMYVRLAFAVAAHLEPEILIIDEVLAVGDAKFQDKCLGKIGDVAFSHGRSVLFVSHNMTAIRTLCSRALLLKNGTISLDSTPIAVSRAYLHSDTHARWAVHWPKGDGTMAKSEVRINRVEVQPQDAPNLSQVTIASPLQIIVDYSNYTPNATLNVSLVLKTEDDICVLNSFSPPAQTPEGPQRSTCMIPANLLNAERYSLRVLIVKDSSRIIHDIDRALSFELHDVPREGAWLGKWIGVVRPKLQWSVQSIPQHETNQ